MIEPSISLKTAKNCVIASCPALDVEFRAKNEPDAVQGCRDRCLDRLVDWRRTLECVTIEDVNDDPAFKHHVDEVSGSDPDEDDEIEPPDYRPIPQAPAFGIRRSGQVFELDSKKVIEPFCKRIGKSVYPMVELSCENSKYGKGSRREHKALSVRSLLMQVFGYETAEGLAV